MQTKSRYNANMSGTEHRISIAFFCVSTEFDPPHPQKKQTHKKKNKKPLYTKQMPG